MEFTLPESTPACLGDCLLIAGELNRSTARAHTVIYTGHSSQSLHLFRFSVSPTKEEDGGGKEREGGDSSVRINPSWFGFWSSCEVGDIEVDESLSLCLRSSS